MLLKISGSFHDLKSSRLVSRYRFTFMAYSGSTTLGSRLIVIPTSIREVICREWDFQIGTDLLSELLPTCHFCQSSHPPKICATYAVGQCRCIEAMYQLS